MKKVDLNEAIVLKQGDTVLENKFTRGDLKRIDNKIEWGGTFSWILLGILIFGLLLPNFKLAYTASSSMVPTLSVGDFVFYGPVGRNVERGDIIMFEPTESAEQASFLTGGTIYYEKRVIGLPGETIRIESGVVYINGEPLDEPYAAFSSDPSHARYRDMEEMTIPEGYYFVMGDNRDHSYDSRGFGVISRESIKRSYLFSFPSLSGLFTGVSNDELFLG